MTPERIAEIREHISHLACDDCPWDILDECLDEIETQRAYIENVQEMAARMRAR